jgi:hypothetical protein
MTTREVNASPQRQHIQKSLETFQTKHVLVLQKNHKPQEPLFVRQIMGCLALHGYTRPGIGRACQMRATECAEKIRDNQG